MTPARKFTASAPMLARLARAAKDSGCAAEVVFPDGMRIVLTPVDEAAKDGGEYRPFKGMQ